MKKIIIVVFLGLFSSGFAETKCITPNGEEAQCVPFKQCDVFMTAILNKPSDEEKRFLRESHCGDSTTVSNPFVCCGSVVKFKTLDTVDVIFPPLNFTPIEVTTQTPTLKINVTTHKNLHLLPTRNVCGVFNSYDYLIRDKASLEEYAWLALLDYRKNGNTTGFNCGGILINERYVLTAAHCVTGSVVQHAGNVFRVRIGEQDLRTNPDCDYEGYCVYHQDIEVEEVIPHPSYNLTGEELNDIALVRLATPAIFGDTVNPICLPINGEMSNPDRSASTTIIGWKQNQNLSTIGNENNLKYFGHVTLIPLDECRKKYAPKQFKLTDQHFCVHDLQGASRCVSDSGGPIVNVFPPVGRWFVDGVLSVKICYPDEKRPSIYINTRVAYYVSWILDNLRP